MEDNSTSIPTKGIAVNSISYVVCENLSIVYHIITIYACHNLTMNSLLTLYGDMLPTLIQCLTSSK